MRETELIEPSNKDQSHRNTSFPRNPLPKSISSSEMAIPCSLETQRGQQLDGSLEPTGRTQGLGHAGCVSSVDVVGPDVAQGVPELRLVPGKTEHGRGW